jgi:hypothetical protein
MVHPGAEDAVTAQAIDVFAVQDVLEDGTLPRPFDGRELAGFRHRLAIGDETAVVIGGVILDGLSDEGLLLFQ